jgi:tartrate-resistant acid phosphatase type 5
MSHDSPMTRRRLLKTLFCSSVAMKLNLSSSATAQIPPAPGSLELLAIGDFGSGNENQTRVARAMATYTDSLARRPDGLLMLGDNFYGKMPDGLKSPRWQTGFSNLYPGKTYPGPCWPILGNHDYNDHPGGEKIQLEYAASLDRKTRWTMPGKFYRLDLPADKPQVTFLMIDTNWKPINRRTHGDKYPCWMITAEQAAQKVWLDAQLASPRAPFTVVVGHHPLYCDGSHGDTPELIHEFSDVFNKSDVHLYLCGHDHDLQHLELENHKTSFVISGGGGQNLHDPVEPMRPGTTFKKVHGFTHLSLIENRLHVRHIDDLGRNVHAFSKGVNHDWKLEA